MTQVLILNNLYFTVNSELIIKIILAHNLMDILSNEYI